MSMASNVPAWQDQGPADAQQAVVFLHGIGGGRAAWAAQQAHVAQRGWRSLAWDMPGYGDSALCQPYDFEHLAQALMHMLDAAKVKQAVLVGHSMGAMVALQAWTQAPKRLLGLLLAASSPAFGQPDGEFQQRFLAQRLDPLTRGQGMAEIAERLIPSMLSPAGQASAWALARQSMAAVAPDTYRAALHALVRFEQRAALPTISVPVLCLAAEHDSTAPAAVLSRMAEKIPNAQYACLAGAGHLLHDEQPEAFNRAMDLLLNRVKAP